MASRATGGEPEFVQEQIAAEFQVEKAEDAQGEETEAHETGDARTIKLLQQVLFDGPGSLLLLSGLKLGHVHGHASLDGLEHDFGLSVGLLLPGAGNQPYNGNGQYDANENRQTKIR